MSAKPQSRGRPKDDFYLRYYIGHKGRFGHEFMEFEFQTNGVLRYANASNYKGDVAPIRKEVPLSTAVIDEVKRIVKNSEVMKEDDSNWPEPDEEGKQELEIFFNNEHISFACRKIGSLIDVNESDDPEGLRVMYYVVQDLKCLVLSLISLHFKIKPHPH